MIWAPCGSGEGADGLGGIWGHGGVSLDTCMHAHARNVKINMLENCKWPPPWRQPCLSCLTCMHVCKHVRARACVRTCVGGAPTQSHPHPPTHQGGYPPQISKNAIRLGTNQDISIPFEDLESVENSPPMGGCFFGWVGGWMGGLVGRKM